MITLNNFIYTEKGIYSTKEFMDEFILKTHPKVMSFNADTLCYEFQEIDEIETITNLEIYELKFIDVFSSRNIIINSTNTAEILQYNIFHTDFNSLVNKSFQTLRFINSNVDNERLHLEWKQIKNLFNYANKSPNIVLGDTVVKYVSKRILEKSDLYSFKFENTIIPIFSLMTRTTHSNFILIK